MAKDWITFMEAGCTEQMFGIYRKIFSLKTICL